MCPQGLKTPTCNCPGRLAKSDHQPIWMSISGAGLHSSMVQDVTTSDLDFVQRHRDMCAARPEMRSAYHEFCGQFDTLTAHFRPPEEMHSTGTPPSPTTWSDTTGKYKKDHCSLCGQSLFLVCCIFRLSVSSAPDRCRHT
jgi:hypothetical protein